MPTTTQPATDTRRTLTLTLEVAGRPVVVRGCRDLHGGAWHFDAWEPTVFMATDARGHSTITSDLDGRSKWWGRIGTRRLPAELDALPRGQERIDRVGAWHAEQYREAHVLIVWALHDAGELELAGAAAAAAGRADGRDMGGLTVRR